MSLDVRALRIRPLLWPAVSVIAAVLLIRPLLMHAGLPGFNQDWSWPPSIQQAITMFAASTRPYLSNDYGGPNFYIGGAGFWAATALFSSLFGVETGLRVLLFVLLLLAFGGAFVLTRYLGAGYIAAGPIALAFAASPVVGNELAAGHMAYLLGYACLPWVFFCALLVAKEDRPLRGLLGIAVIVPISIAQPQFAAFNALLCGAALPFARDWRRICLVLGCAFYAVAASPYALALAIFAHPVRSLSVDQTNLHWEAANSTPLGQAFLAAGYPPGYDLLAPRVLLMARIIGAGLFWVLALAGVMYRPRLSVVFACAVAATLACAGVNGPLAGLLDWTFTHIPAMALFRELYHFSGLAVVALCICASAVRWRYAGGIAVVAAVAYAAAQLTGGFWGAVKFYDPRPIQEVARTIAADRTGGYVLFLPLLQPMGAPGRHFGADVQAFSIGDHPALSEFVPVQPLSQIDFLLRRHTPDPTALLRDLGVRYVVLRPGWRSAYFTRMEPSLRKLVRSHGVPPEDLTWVQRHLHIVLRARGIVVARIDGPSGVVRDRVHPDAVPLYRLPIQTRPEQSVATADPRSGWIPGTAWQWWSPAFSGPVNPGIFSIGVPWHLGREARGALLLDAPGGGRLKMGRHLAPVAASQRFHAVGKPGVPSIFYPRGAAMIAGEAEALPMSGEGCSRVVPDVGGVRVLAASCAAIGVEVIALRDTGWVLRDRYGDAMAPRDTSWDLQWSVSRRDAPYLLDRELPLPWRIGMICQYAVWIIAASGVILLLALSLRTSRSPA